jgi:protein Mpv17
LLIIQQVFINQAFFTPLFNSYFFGMQSLLSGATLPEILERIKNTVPTSWYNSCKLWPAVTAFSFTYIPIEYRSIFGGVIAIGWQTYLSLLNTRAAAKEEMEHAAMHDAPASVRTTQRLEHGLLEQKCAA